MDGIFGCKVSFDYNEQTRSIEFKFAKKTIVDWVMQIFCNEEKKSDQNADVMLALMAIETDIGDADNGKFKTLVKNYANDPNLIDFREIRRTLRSSLDVQFPPIVYERPAIKGQLGQAEKNFFANPNIAPKSETRQRIDGTTNSKALAVQNQPEVLKEIKDSFSHAAVQKIDKRSADGDASSPDNKRNLSRQKMLDGGRLPDFRSKDGLMYVQDWVDIYQARLTNETFVIDDTARVYCEHDASITESNLQAFCYALLTLDNNGELPKSIFGGSESNDAWIYSMLCKSNPECAEKVKSRMQNFSETSN